MCGNARLLFGGQSEVDQQGGLGGEGFLVRKARKGITRASRIGSSLSIPTRAHPDRMAETELQESTSRAASSSGTAWDRAESSGLLFGCSSQHHGTSAVTTMRASRARVIPAVHHWPLAKNARKSSHRQAISHHRMRYISIRYERRRA